MMGKNFRYRSSLTAAKILLYFLLLQQSPDSFTIAAVSNSKRIRKNNDPSARRFRVRNLSAYDLEVYWVNMKTEERLLQFELVPGASDSLNSHIFHEFEIREKENRNGECAGKKGRCRKRHFQISLEEDQVFTVDKEFKVEISNSRTLAKERAKKALNNCRDLEDYMDDDDTVEKQKSPEEQLDQLAQCMTRNVQESLYKLQEEIDFQATIRRRMGTKLKDYACNDPKFPTTKPIDVKEWNPNNPRLVMDEKDHTINVLLQSETTLIATIEHMVRPWDCEFVQDGAGIAVSGTSSSHHDHQSGGDAGAHNHHSIPWEARKNPAFLDFLSRIYAYVDPAMKLIDMYARLPKPGEVLFELHQDTAAPPHQTTRNYISEWPVEGHNFARLLMFCDVPEVGGAIHFPESGVHVNPKVGEGILITYTKQSATKQNFLESFSNEHYECPILQGKRTVVQHQFRLVPMQGGAEEK